MTTPRAGTDKFSLSEALKRFGRPVVFYPSLAKLVGIEEAILLAQLCYWTPRSKSESGWIYKSAEDLEHETGLTYRQQFRARETLRERRVLEERYVRDEHRLYFRVIPDTIDNLTSGREAPDETSDAQPTKRQMAPDETSDGTLPFVGSLKEAESTAETTSERAAPDRSRQDTRSGTGPQRESERQPTNEPKIPAWPSEPVRADLFGGLHSGFEGKTGMHEIAKAFHDSQRLPFREQLRECVIAGVTVLVLMRNGKLGALDPGDIEKRALGKLATAGETLRTFELVKDSETRSRLVTQYIARIVTESAAEIFEAEYGAELLASSKRGAQ